MVPRLAADDWRFPPTAQALDAASSGTPESLDGLLAYGGDLEPGRLEQAYRHGIFPWFAPGQPILWWSLAPRMVLEVDPARGHFRLQRSLRKTLQRFIAAPGHEIRIDHDCPAVIAACAVKPRPGQDGTWIVPEMVQAYSRWHREAAQVHSVETWIDGELAGGLYCVSISGMVFGESMFAHWPDASKFALAALVAFCRLNGLPRIDCQQQTAHLARFGALPQPREVFERHLTESLALPGPARWVWPAEGWSALPELIGS
jgi:leucyl/phenylalanyl-tRNA---protein transferase